MSNYSMLSPATKKKLLKKLDLLRDEHRKLDEQIEHAGQAVPMDQLDMSRLKRRKLQLKDEIREIEEQVVPDIVA